jgi:hypothetical protein
LYVIFTGAGCPSIDLDLADLAVVADLDRQQHGGRDARVVAVLRVHRLDELRELGRLGHDGAALGGGLGGARARRRRAEGERGGQGDQRNEAAFHRSACGQLPSSNRIWMT